jgi:hypothetical protein
MKDINEIINIVKHQDKKNWRKGIGTREEAPKQLCVLNYAGWELGYGSRVASLLGLNEGAKRFKRDYGLQARDILAIGRINDQALDHKEAQRKVIEYLRALIRDRRALNG